MSAVATYLARRIPLLGGLLLIAAGFGFLLQLLNQRADLDGIFAALILILSVFCLLRRRAIEEPGKCRILLFLGLATDLVGQIVRMVIPGSGLSFSLTWIFYFLTTFAYFLGIIGLLGCTLALRDDPDNESARRLRQNAAVITFVGFGLLLLSEIIRVIANRGVMGSIAAGASIFTLFIVLVRGSLAIGAFLVLLRPPQGDGVFRRESLILKALLASVAFSIVSWVVFVIMVVFKLLPGLRDLAGRFLWLNAVHLLLLVLSSALVPIAVRKPESADAGYNSPSGTNSSGGAEA